MQVGHLEPALHLEACRGCQSGARNNAWLSSCTSYICVVATLSSGCVELNLCGLSLLFHKALEHVQACPV
jgi:hypothetical protein